MNKTFEEMFSREPDEIINGDYFYKTWYKNIELSEKPCEIREIRDKEFRYEGFRQEWKAKLNHISEQRLERRARHEKLTEANDTRTTRRSAGRLQRESVERYG